ncbi:MAG: TldD/PmbA family protein [Chloroflexi bacterium]|nr:TldD/PmbA family protein [Chloroflexota bacterium]
MEEILAKARRVAEEADVFLVSAEETPVQFEANRIKNIQSKQSTMVALRVVRGGKVGYASSTSLGDSLRIVDMAVQVAQFGAEARFELPTMQTYPRVDIYDAEVENTSLNTMVGLGEELIGKLLKHTPGLICDGRVTRGSYLVRILNSRGGEANYRETVFSLGIGGTLIRDTDMLFVGDNESSCHPVLSSDKIASKVLEQLELAKNKAQVQTKMMPVVFTPDGVASAFTASLMTAFNGKMVIEGASPIGDKLGQKAFDEKLSLHDDPTIAYRPSSRPCDDEGVASQVTPLIEGGVVKSFLYDLQTAALGRTRSTGSASRSRGGVPVPSPSAFVITPGDVTFEQMVSDIREGLVIEELMGAEQGNTLGGDFGGNVLLGYKIENGKIIGRVKDTMVAGNVYQLLRDIAAIGSETKWVGRGLNVPALYFSRVSVTAKG